MPVILCIINQFALNQQIYLVDKETKENKLIAEVKSDDVGHTIVTYSHENNLDEVILTGANNDYLNKFADDVYTINEMMYQGQSQLNVFILE